MSKKHRRRSVALVLGTIVVLAAAATHVYAAPIRFDNPPGDGHYEWGAIPEVGDEVILSILDGPAEQTAVVGDSGAYRQRNRTYGTDVRRAGPTGEGVQFVFSPASSVKLLIGVDAGDAIPTGSPDDFTSSAYTYRLDAAPGDPHTMLPEGEETYVGVRFFDLGGGTDYQYGWIGVVRTGMFLDAFAWGYETEPGVSIAAGAPEPGTLAVLVLGGMALAGCRRRRPVEL